MTLTINKQLYSFGNFLGKALHHQCWQCWIWTVNASAPDDDSNDDNIDVRNDNVDELNDAGK